MKTDYDDWQEFDREHDPLAEILTLGRPITGRSLGMPANAWTGLRL